MDLTPLKIAQLGERRIADDRKAAVARCVRRIDVVKRIELRSSWSFHIVALPE